MWMMTMPVSGLGIGLGIGLVVLRMIVLACCGVFRRVQDDPRLVCASGWAGKRNPMSRCCVGA